jgi:hypothetical protein
MNKSKIETSRHRQQWFRIFSILGIFIFATHAIAGTNTFFVRKTQIGQGVPNDQASIVTAQIAEAVQAAGTYSLVGGPSNAGIVIRPHLNLQNGKYVLKLERTRFDKVLQSQQTTFVSLDGVSAALKGILPQILAVKEDSKLPQMSAHVDNMTQGSESWATPGAVVVPDRETASAPEVGTQAMVPVEPAKAIMNTQALFKHWLVTLGPAWSTALLGNAGTKYNVSFAYVNALAEHLNLNYFYDVNFNSNMMGESDIATVGVAPTYFLNDRLAEQSPYGHFDLGYGGVNRYEDGGLVAAVGLGMMFYRDRPMSFEVELRYQMLFTAKVSNGVEVNPNVTQFRVGILF